MTDASLVRPQSARRTVRLAPLLALALGVASLAGCTLLESPDDHFREADTSADGGDTAGDMVSGSQLCNDYCTRFLELCSSDPANTYADEADCLTQCATLPAGSPTDYARNSVNCRMNHFGAAISLPADHCPHASFSGGEQCVGDEVSPCEAYCGLLSENCPQTFESLAVEGGLSATAMCVKGCGMFLPSPGTAGEPIYASDSLECHSAFLERMTAPNMPGLYCQAAMPTDAQACRGAIGVTENLCEAVCLIALNECAGDLPFLDFAQCHESCTGETQEAVECTLEALTRETGPACDEINPIGEACGTTPTCTPGETCGAGCGPMVTADQCACGPGMTACSADGTLTCLGADGDTPVVQRNELPETCANLLDDDCDGAVDEADCTP